MKNIVTCKNCSAENPFYGFTCNSCKSYLRERVVNIDLWDTLGVMIDSPAKAFSRIVFAEHKNFIFFILFFVCIKFTINTFLIASQLLNIGLSGNPILYFLLILAGVITISLMFGLLLKYINTLFKLNTRFFDNFAVLSYSQIPHVYALIFLFTVELVLFGAYLISYNPSPFMLKSTPAYILTGMEGIMLLWCMGLSVAAVYSQTRAKIYSIVMGLLYNLLLLAVIFLVIAILG